MTAAEATKIAETARIAKTMSNIFAVIKKAAEDGHNRTTIDRHIMSNKQAEILCNPPYKYKVKDEHYIDEDGDRINYSWVVEWDL